MGHRGPGTLPPHLSKSWSLPAPHLPDSQAAPYQWVGLDAVSSRPGVLRVPQEHRLHSQVFSMSSISILFWLKAFIPSTVMSPPGPPSPVPLPGECQEEGWCLQRA